MEQLLKITRIPVEYQLKITNAKYERSSDNIELQITRDRGGFQMESEPARVLLDTSKARSSIKPTTKESVYQFADKGRSHVDECNARYAREGKMFLKAKGGDAKNVFRQLIEGRIAPPTGEFQLGFLPTAGVDITVTEPKLSMEYQMDRLHFDWKVQQGEIKYVPGSVKLEVVQKPELKIEYIGKPMYVPPSFAEKMNGGGVDIQA